MFSREKDDVSSKWQHVLKDRNCAFEISSAGGLIAGCQGNKKQKVPLEKMYLGLTDLCAEATVIPCHVLSLPGLQRDAAAFSRVGVTPRSCAMSSSL